MLPETTQETLPDIFDYSKAKVRITKLISQWAPFKTKAEENRKSRKLAFDVKKLRAEGSIEQDETFVPSRIIDSNISRDKADAMNFLNATKRLAYFRCKDDPTVDTRALETDFTKGLTYEGWYPTFDKHYDGAALHGWDSIEVIYDDTKPLKIAFEQIGYDKLFFNSKVGDIQNSDLILREYEATTYQLEEMVADNGFDPAQIEMLIARNRDQKKDDCTFTIYKVFFKFKKVVYVAWFSQETAPQSWLKAPEKLRCGILKQQVQTPDPLSLGATIASQVNQGGELLMPAPSESLYEEEDVTAYPIFLYIYRDDEEEAITKHEGRAFYDAPQQEATTVIQTAFCNGCIRASNVYAAPEDDEEGFNKLEGVTLEAGVFLPAKIKFFNMPYPDPTLLSGLQYLGVVNSQQTGKMSAAVSNRKDSRKTAKELDVASNEQQKITSTNLATYSEFLRQLFSFAWRPIQSQAIAGNVQLLLTSEQDPQTGELTWKNNVNIIGLNFDIRAAGDIDVVQNELMLQNMQQDWPVIQTTALAGKFMEDFVRRRYPEHAEEYVRILQAGSPQAIIQSLLSLLQGALQPEELAALNPQQQQQLQTVVMSAQQFVQKVA